MRRLRRASYNYNQGKLDIKGVKIERAHRLGKPRLRTEQIQMAQQRKVPTRPVIGRLSS